MKLLVVLFIFVHFGIQPIFAQSQSLRINSFFSYQSKQYLGLINNLASNDKGIAKFDINYDEFNISSQLSLNYDENNEFNFDRSYLEYTKGIATFGIGAVDRNWSFSNNTSLILSNNARASRSIYAKLKNRFKYDWLPSKADWSLEIFNGYTNGSLNKSKAMLLGIRAILSPIEGLDFELVQTSQWGGNQYKNGISALSSALLFDTNNSSNANINKMAGLGISYQIRKDIIPLRIYGQTVGEDEAGNMPSCLTYLVGLEWTLAKIKNPTYINFETIDTRIDTTKHGNCGPNTMYNNNTYDYTNYGKVMGAAIDTEGKSFAIYIHSKLSQNIDIRFASKSVLINDDFWSDHRLSSKRETGSTNSLGVSWNKNNISFNGDIYNQNFSLDKVNIKKGIGISISSSITF